MRRLGEHLTHGPMVAPGVEHAHALRALAGKDKRERFHRSKI
jgi:hypothetical protein